MRIADVKKRAMDFATIRPGTVFTCGDSTYIKGTIANQSLAINLEDGQIIDPDVSGLKIWDECYIYPHASITLNGSRTTGSR